MSPTLAPGGAFTEVAFPSAPAIIRLPLRDITTEPGLPTVCFPLVFVVASVSVAKDAAPNPRPRAPAAFVSTPRRPFLPANKARSFTNFPGIKRAATVPKVVIPFTMSIGSKSPFINLVIDSTPDAAAFPIVVRAFARPSVTPSLVIPRELKRFTKLSLNLIIFLFFLSAYRTVG